MDHVLIHDAASVARISNAARLARRLLDYVCHPSIAKVGVTAAALDDLLRDATLEAGAYPSPLNYRGFPRSVCSSVNEVVCHGIPDGRALEAGDVASFDVSCYVGGVHGGRGEGDEVEEIPGPTGSGACASNGRICAVGLAHKTSLCPVAAVVMAFRWNEHPLGLRFMRGQAVGREIENVHDADPTTCGSVCVVWRERVGIRHHQELVPVLREHG